MHSQDRACATLCHPRLQHACDIPSPPSSCTWRLGPTVPKYVSGTIALPTFESPACAMVLAVPSSRRCSSKGRAWERRPFMHYTRNTHVMRSEYFIFAPPTPPRRTTPRREN